MELRELFGFLRRWTWLLILGAVLGGGAAYFYSSTSQTPVYQATTKVMVIQPTESLASDLTDITDIELAETFRNLLTTKPVLDSAREQTGVSFGSGQISSSLIEGTLLLQVTVRDGDPGRAALVANALVDSLIEQNEAIQSDRFLLSEARLQAQISEVEGQISALRAQAEEPKVITPEELEERRLGLESEILALGNQIAEVDAEIDELTSSGNDPVAAPQQPGLVSEKQAQLSLLRINSNLAVARYEELLPWASEEQLQEQQGIVLSLAAQISDLIGEIELLTATPEPPQITSEVQDQVTELFAEKAILQLNMDIANQRYRQFVLTDPSEDSDSGLSPQTESNIALYEQIHSSLLSNYEAVRLARLQSTPNVVQVERAAPPASAVGTNEFTNMLLGAAAGLFVMAGIAFLIEYLDDTLKTPEDVYHFLNLPIIGYLDEVPELKRSASNSSADQMGPYAAINPRSPVAESFRGIRTNLQISDKDHSLGTILVTSPGPEEGKTTVAANLAAVYSQENKLTILLDCDLRRPEIHKIFGYDNKVGLSNRLTNQDPSASSAILWSESLAVIPSGSLPPNPTELLGSKEMSRVLERLKEVAEIVVIDSPPSVVSDAVLLSRMVDGVVIVVHPGHTQSGAAIALLEQLERAGATVIGVVMNRIARKKLGYYGRYGYKHASYYYSKDGHYYGNDAEEGSDQRDKQKPNRRSIPLLRKGS